MIKPVFALVDCNNFFVSCERLFRPDLQDKPVVVLSSNDGCVVARSNESKALGIPMGAPAFQWRDVFERHQVVQFSANFSLYGDISRRITAILASVTPQLEIYSIDEAFLDLSQLPITNYADWAYHVQQCILQWVGIPVSIGIGSSKTLAKLASEHAKQDTTLHGTLSLIGQNTQPFLQQTDIQSVWGVGWRLTPKLRAEGIHTAASLAALRPRRAQQLMGIRGRQLITELGGTSCFPLETEDKPRQSIERTRTFGHDTNNLSDLEAAIATFVSRAAFRLRQDSLLAQRGGLFLTTNRKKLNYQSWNRAIHLPYPTADTGTLITWLIRELAVLHQPAIAYHRAGVWLGDFISSSPLQMDLLGTVNPTTHDRSARRMKAVDGLNERFGNHAITFGTTLLGNHWEPIRQNQSPAYTTNWAEIPILSD